MTMTVKQHSALISGIADLRQLSNELRSMAPEFEKDMIGDGHVDVRFERIADALVEHADELEEVVNA